MNRGTEMRGNFDVKIRHGRNPVSGATIEITGLQGPTDANAITVQTDHNGIAHIINLPPGDYWMQATYLGVGAAYHCFHVDQKPSRKAKRSEVYDWGDLAPGTRRIAGKLQDSQPGTGGSPIWNLIHRTQVPIVGANLTLHNATSGEVYHTISDANGAFAFDGIPKGTYVLHLDAGKIGVDRDYEASSEVLKLDPNAKSGSFLYQHLDASGGSCGGSVMAFEFVNDKS